MNTHTTAPAESLPANPTTRGHRRRALLAGISGYVLEWFDFGVYGFLAPIIAKNFFPAANDHVALLV